MKLHNGNSVNRTIKQIKNKNKIHNHYVELVSLYKVYFFDQITLIYLQNLNRDEKKNFNQLLYKESKFMFNTL